MLCIYIFLSRNSFTLLTFPQVSSYIMYTVWGGGECTVRYVHSRLLFAQLCLAALFLNSSVLPLDDVLVSGAGGSPRVARQLPGAGPQGEGPPADAADELGPDCLGNHHARQGRCPPRRPPPRWRPSRDAPPAPSNPASVLPAPLLAARPSPPARGVSWRIFSHYK